MLVQEDQSTVQLLSAVAMKNKSKNKLMTRKWIFVFKSAKGWVVHWCCYQVLVYNIPSVVHVEQCPALISLLWNINNCTCQNVRKIGKADWQKRANIVKNSPELFITFLNVEWQKKRLQQYKVENSFDKYTVIFMSCTPSSSFCCLEVVNTWRCTIYVQPVLSYESILSLSFKYSSS